MEKIVVVVKHKDMRDTEFYVANVEIDNGYNIYTTISHYKNDALLLDDRDIAINLRKLVSLDFKVKNGYTVYLKNRRI